MRYTFLYARWCFAAGTDLSQHQRDHGDSPLAQSESPSEDEGREEPVVDSPPDLLSPRPRRSALWSRAGEELMAGLKTFASVAVYTTLIITFGFQVARVEGRSMEPTLADQDRLIVNKALYRFVRVPEPGEIVMLRYPKDPEKAYVKRIIAMEGDTVLIEDGRVYVNQVLLPDEYVAPHFRSHGNHGPVVVEAAHYFVMGDHRNNSLDSRDWGLVPEKYVIGKVQLRWWPLTSATIF